MGVLPRKILNIWCAEIASEEACLGGVVDLAARYDFYPYLAARYDFTP